MFAALAGLLVGALPVQNLLGDTAPLVLEDFLSEGDTQGEGESDLEFEIEQEKMDQRNGLGYLRPRTAALPVLAKAEYRSSAPQAPMLEQDAPPPEHS